MESEQVSNSAESGEFVLNLRVGVSDEEKVGSRADHLAWTRTQLPFCISDIPSISNHSPQPFHWIYSKEELQVSLTFNTWRNILLMEMK